jgi:hypothetical protein
MDPLTKVLTDVPRRGPAAGFAHRRPAPNPFRSATTLHYLLGAESRVRLDVYDAQGRVVHQRDLGVQAAGERSSFVAGLRGKTGVYLYRLHMTDPVTGEEQAQFTGRLLLVR